MPTPYDPSWDREQREQEMWEEEQWQRRVERRAGLPTSKARIVGAIILLILIVLILI